MRIFDALLNYDVMRLRFKAYFSKNTFLKKQQSSCNKIVRDVWLARMPFFGYNMYDTQHSPPRRTIRRRYCRTRGRVPDIRRLLLLPVPGRVRGWWPWRRPYAVRVFWPRGMAARHFIFHHFRSRHRRHRRGRQHIPHIHIWSFAPARGRLAFKIS